MDRTGRGNALAFAALALVMLLWAGNAIVGRAVRDMVPPFTLAFVRWTGAFLILLPFAARHLIADRALLLRHAGIVLLLGLFGVGAFNALFYSGLHYTSATNGLLLQAAIPAFTLLFDRLFFAERAPIAQATGVALSTLGVVLIVLRGDFRLLLEFRLGFGDMLILGAVVAWAVYTSMLRLRPAVHPLSFLAATFLIGIICMAPLFAMEWINHGFPPLTTTVLGAFSFVALLPSVVAYLLFNAAVARIGAGKASQTIALMPLFGAGLASLLLGERLHVYHLAGMALILFGIAIGTLAGRRRV